MDDPIFAAFIECAQQCEEIAVEILPSYSTRYADVDAMIRMPPSVLACPFKHQLAFMQGKLKYLEKMRSDLPIPSESASAAGCATEDLPCKEHSVKKKPKTMKIKSATLD